MNDIDKPTWFKFKHQILQLEEDTDSIFDE